MMALALAAALAQDGGVYVYDRAALLMPSGAIVTVDAGVAMDGPVAIARANELERARATPRAETPQWVTTVAAVVAAGVYAADQVRRWVQPQP